MRRWDRNLRYAFSVYPEGWPVESTPIFSIVIWFLLVLDGNLVFSVSNHVNMFWESTLRAACPHERTQSTLVERTLFRPSEKPGNEDDHNAVKMESYQPRSQALSSHGQMKEPGNEVGRVTRCGTVIHGESWPFSGRIWLPNYFALSSQSKRAEEEFAGSTISQSSRNHLRQNCTNKRCWYGQFVRVRTSFRLAGVILSTTIPLLPLTSWKNTSGRATAQPTWAQLKGNRANAYLTSLRWSAFVTMAA